MSHKKPRMGRVCFSHGRWATWLSNASSAGVARLPNSHVMPRQGQLVKLGSSASTHSGEAVSVYVCHVPGVLTAHHRF